MWDKDLEIVCCADEAVLIAENENDFERLIHQIDITAK